MLTFNVSKRERVQRFQTYPPRQYIYVRASIEALALVRSQAHKGEHTRTHTRNAIQSVRIGLLIKRVSTRTASI